MEQNVDASAPVTPVVDNKQKGRNGLKIATAIACIVAACGIGFGVYGIIDANSTKDSLVLKDAKISDLDSEITKLNTKIDELEKQVDAQQKSSNSDSGETIKTTVDDRKLTVEIQDGIFMLKNGDGIVVAQDDTKNIVEIISCDSGTDDSNSPLKCNTKTVDGKSAWFIYDFENKELKSGYSSVDY